MLIDRLKPFFICSIFVLLAACQSFVPLVNSIDERQANEIIVFLASKGITAQKEAASSGSNVGGGSDTEILWNIVVDAKDSPDAMAILSRNGLPRRQGKTLLDLFGNTGLVPTDTQQRILYQAGLADQIANMIRQIDGVIDVSVQLSIPTEEDQHPTASVYVKHQGVLDNPNTQLLLKIRQMVAASISGLTMDNVTVIADRSRFTDISLNPSSTAAPDQVRDYVNIWGVTIAKDSAAAFQFLFFTLFFLLFVLLIGLGWIFWKTRPLMEKAGGVALLFSKEPFATNNAPQEKTASSDTVEIAEPVNASKAPENAPAEDKGTKPTIEKRSNKAAAPPDASSKGDQSPPPPSK